MILSLSVEPRWYGFYLSNILYHYHIYQRTTSCLCVAHPITYRIHYIIILQQHTPIHVLFRPYPYLYSLVKYLNTILLSEVVLKFSSRPRNTKNILCGKVILHRRHIIYDIEVVIHLGVIYMMREYRIAGNKQVIRIISFPVP